MKKILLLTMTMLSGMLLTAQGIYQLWGMTKQGGNLDKGVMFSTDGRGNNFQERFEFYHTNAGARPVYTQPIEYNGKFYGMTSGGGSTTNMGTDGAGVIFEWDPATNTYTKKVDLNAAIGSNPMGSLTLSSGRFYGMTSNGGSNDAGVIFEWDPGTNVYTKKVDLSTINGSHPQGSLTESGDKFYGMTLNGGAYDKGVIFEWDPVTNLYTKKFDFTGDLGANPYGDLTLDGGLFYGITSAGGDNGMGTIFEWDPATNLYSKKINLIFSNGSKPTGSLTKNAGKFYGATSEGGLNNYGVIFEWNPANNYYSKKIDLTLTGGSVFGNLTMFAGKFYGMTFRGGGIMGVIFEWDPNSNVFTVKRLFEYTSGCNPFGSLTLSGGKFFGMTNYGGGGDYDFLSEARDRGVLFEWNPVTNLYIVKVDFFYAGAGFPTGSLVMNDGKFYGMSMGGGSNSKGVLFEWDPDNNIHTKKVDLDYCNRNSTQSHLTWNEGKLYGMTSGGGTNVNGGIFEWDPVTNVSVQKFEFNGLNGSVPLGSLTAIAGKFYGMTKAGGNYNKGVIFEWDPIANVYSKKFDFDSVNGSNPYGTLSEYNGNLYGLTYSGGISNLGVIFEWNHSAGVFTKKFDFDSVNGSNPSGSLTLNNGKFYGTACKGGTINKGVIFEWNPSSDVYIKKFDFNGTDGAEPKGSLTMSGGKFYGMTSTGGVAYEPGFLGTIFEWDPGTNIYTKKHDFTMGIGVWPDVGNDLTLAPASVAKGTPGSCVAFPSVTIDNSNSNQWVPIVDNEGNAVAEIKANGNNLGVVATSMYVHNGSVREDVGKRLYLDRNLSITSQQQPLSPVDIRLYIKGSEYLALKNALNSNNDPSGISTINDISIFKNDNSCEPAIDAIASPLVTTAAAWQTDYVFSASTSTFSSFYFASKIYTALPVTLLEFSGRLINGNVSLTWITTNEQNNSVFEIERSTDGSNYIVVGKVASVNTPGINNYFFTDSNITAADATMYYYRLKQKEYDGGFTYSKIIAINFDRENTVSFYPNPVINKINLFICVKKPEKLSVRLLDNTGRVLTQKQWNLVTGNNPLFFDVNQLEKGMYYIELKGTTFDERKQFIKL